MIMLDGVLELRNKKRPFPLYDVEEAEVWFRDEKTRYKAILREGELVAIVSKRYKLLPNELVLEVAREVAEEVNAVQLKKRGLLFNKEQTRMYANFVILEPIKVEDNDLVYPGFTITNSIDASLAFTSVGFTFRSLCENGVFLGYSKLIAFHRRHTSRFDIDKVALKRIILSTIEYSKETIKLYKKMTDIMLNEEIAKSLAEHLPAYMLKDYMKIKTKIVDGQREREIKILNYDVSLWNIYNVLTARIWRQNNPDKVKCLCNRLHKAVIPYVTKSSS